MPFVRMFAVLCLSMPALCAADWTYVDVSTRMVDLNPTHAIATTNGFTLYGVAAGRNAQANYAASGQLLAARYLDNDIRGQYGVAQMLGAALRPDGSTLGLFFAFNEAGEPACEPDSFGPDYSLVWRTWLMLTPDCRLLGIDTTGGAWVATDLGIGRITADGVSANTAFGRPPTADAIDAASGTLYAAADDGPEDFNAITAYRLDHSTQVLWHATDAATKIESMSVGNDHNVYAVGTNANAIVALSLDPSGNVRWLHTIAAFSGVQVRTAAGFSGGGLVALDQNETVYAFSSDGTRRYQKSIAQTCHAFCVGTSSDKLATSDDGGVAALLGATPLLLRLDAAGNTRASTHFDSGVGFGTGLTLLADDSALVGPLYAPGSDGGAAFAHVAADGTLLDAPATHAILRQQEYPTNTAQDLDGTLYIISADVIDWYANPRNWLSRISPDGQRVWKVELPSLAYSPRLQIGADRVCYATYDLDTFANAIQCRAAVSGDALWTTGVGALQAMSLLDDGTMVVLSGDPSHSHVISIDGNGAVAHDAELAYAFNTYLDVVAIAANGTVFVSSLFNNGAVFAFSRSGERLYSAATPVQDPAPPLLDGSIVPRADGSAVISIEGSDRWYVWRLDASGQTVWIDPLNLTSAGGPPVLAVAGEKVYVIGEDQFDPHTPAPSPTLRTLALDDGTIQTQLTLPTASYMFSQLDPATGLLLENATGGMYVEQLRLIDPNDGHIVRAIVQSCGANPCGYRAFASFSADGTLRVVSDEPDATNGEHFRVDATLHATTPVPPVRIDQAGLDGAWFAPYESGQGFTLDYIASGKTLFMPWFTYAEPIDDPSQLAWFTLQGNVVPGATSVNLAIGQTNAGAFNSGSVASHVVGSATLSFTNCNSGLLQYRFDSPIQFHVNSGIIALTRLSPSTAPCTLADGSIAPPQIANAPAQGFDANQSGSWFDPSTSGQGVELTVIPKGGSFNGLVFAAWFTFDPTNNSDDDAHQHWFTLQGDLSAAANGSVDLPILRTTGGSLDGMRTSNYTPVGHATLTMQGCDRATLNYEFDASEVAHAFARLNGATQLVKIGGCTMP